MKKENKEESSSKMEKLLTESKKKGSVSYQDINKALPDDIDLTVEDLEKAKNKVDAFNNALGDSIEIKGKFVGKKIKIFFTGTALSIASWFS